MIDHTPQIKNSFKGIWYPEGTTSFFEADETCPKDHQLNMVNAEFTINGIRNRGRFTKSPDFTVPFSEDAKHIYVIDNLIGSNGDLLISTTLGDLYYYNGSTSGTLLIAGPSPDVDYEFLPWYNRIYIILTSMAGYNSVPQGMYIFDGTTPARLAGGTAPGSLALVTNSGVGSVQAGIHFFGVAFETNTGFITPPQGTNPGALLTPGNQLVHFASIPIGGSNVVARWLLATKVIPVRVPSDTIASYLSYFAARIPDNTTTTYDLDFRDSQLLRDASYLNDIFARPPGGTSICSYRNRVCITAPNDGSTDYYHNVLVSRFGEPETFDKIDGLITVSPPNQTVINPQLTTTIPTGFTDSQAYRDVLYVMKLDSTFALTDNSLEPAFWPSPAIDQTIGAKPRGISTVKNPGSESVDYLIVGHTTGIYLFTGLYHRPEITWKIKSAISNLLDDQSSILILNEFTQRRIFFQTGIGVLLHYIDYSQISPDLSNYSQEVKFSEWIIGNAGISFFPSTFFLRNNNLYCFRSEDNLIYQLDSDFSTTDPTDEQYNALIWFPSDRDADDKLIHTSAVRMRISTSNSINSGDITLTLRDLNDVTRFITTPVTINTFSNIVIEPTVTTNFMAQRISVLLNLSANARYNLTKLVTYIKPMYSTIPYQFKV